MATVLRKFSKLDLQAFTKIARFFTSSTKKKISWKYTVTAGSIIGTTATAYLICRKYSNIIFSPILAKEVEDRRDERRHAMQTAREMRFLTFASVEYQGNIYMTPLDFLESVTEDAPRPRTGRKRLTDDEVNHVLKKTPSSKKGSSRLFRNLNESGLISYTEYLFLLCVLTKPQSGFRIAFNMFDTDGNQRVDRKEFLVLEELLTTSVGPETQALDVRSPLITGASNGDASDTTLSVYFFGRKGKNTLKYEDFHSFMDNLQSEVLELEFMEFSRGLDTISEDEFAKILLRYTILTKEENAVYLNRLHSRLDAIKGISFKEFKEFGQFLNNLDDFALAMKMYSFLGQTVTEEQFKRATKAVTGMNLTDHLVHVVFQLFDSDGDGQLSKNEFISVMKDRLHRGFRSQVFTVGKWDVFKSCLKQEMKKN